MPLSFMVEIYPLNIIYQHFTTNNLHQLYFLHFPDTFPLADSRQ
jgi:hypothetical protein